MPPVTPVDPESLRHTAALASRVGGATLMHWRDKFEAREKGPADLVTDADFASQKAIRQVLEQERPGDRFIGEEQPDQRLPPEEDGGVCWVVDPLDGTVNYVHGFPCFATSVAAVQGGRVVAGAIFDPLRSELFTASLGGGATLNGRPLAVSDATELGQSLVAVSLPALVEADSPDLAGFVEVVQLCRAVRRTGSAALNLAYVAAGRLDGHWAHAIHPWDAAAGVLIAAEAGATVTDSRGEPFDVWRASYLVAATAELHRGLADRLAR